MFSLVLFMLSSYGKYIRRSPCKWCQTLLVLRKIVWFKILFTLFDYASKYFVSFIVSFTTFVALVFYILIHKSIEFKHRYINDQHTTTNTALCFHHVENKNKYRKMWDINTWMNIYFFPFVILLDEYIP